MGSSVRTPRAETSEIHVAQQYGISYLPLMLMEEQKLIEKHARANGIPDLTVGWAKFAGGSVMNDALHMTHNLDPVQWDDDPAQELLIASRE